MTSGPLENVLGAPGAGGRKSSMRRRASPKRRPQAEEERRQRIAVRWIATSRSSAEPTQDVTDPRADFRWLAGRRRGGRAGEGRVPLATVAVLLVIGLALVGSLAVKALLMGEDPIELVSKPVAGVSEHLSRGPASGSTQEVPARYPVIPPQGPRDLGASRPGTSAAGPQAKGKVVVEMPEGNANGVKRAKGEKGISTGKVGKSSKTLTGKVVRGSKRDAKAGIASQVEEGLAGGKGGTAVKPGPAAALPDDAAAPEVQAGPSPLAGASAQELALDAAGAAAVAGELPQTDPALVAQSAQVVALAVTDRDS